jgi:DNA-binding GntR family transcriptional regulator
MKRRLSLTQRAYERLRADLLACRLLPGQKLNINTLCEKLGVSLGAVREALSRLTSEGLVTAERGKGFRVTPISSADLVDLTMVRVEIESLCVRRAIAFGDAAWEARLEEAFQQLSCTPDRAPGDPRRVSDAYSAAHAEYHEALVSACRSEWLVRVRRQLHVQSERYRRLSLPLSTGERDLIGEHAEIRDAALARDTERAVALMERHLQVTTDLLLTALQLAPLPQLPELAELALK